MNIRDPPRETMLVMRSRRFIFVGGTAVESGMDGEKIHPVRAVARHHIKNVVFREILEVLVVNAHG